MRRFQEVKRVLTMATSLKARAMLSLAYGCGLRASEVARLQVCGIDSEQMIIRVVQSKGRKDRNVMLPPPEILGLLRQWWKARPKRRDAGVAPERRWLFPDRTPADTGRAAALVNANEGGAFTCMVRRKRRESLLQPLGEGAASRNSTDWPSPPRP